MNELHKRVLLKQATPPSLITRGSKETFRYTLRQPSWFCVWRRGVWLIPPLELKLILFREVAQDTLDA